MMINPDVFSSGVWIECAELKDQELKDLAEFSATMVFQSKPPSTVEKYTVKETKNM